MIQSFAFAGVALAQKSSSPSTKNHSHHKKSKTKKKKIAKRRTHRVTLRHERVAIDDGPLLDSHNHLIDPGKHLIVDFGGGDDTGLEPSIIATTNARPKKLSVKLEAEMDRKFRTNKNFGTAKDSNSNIRRSITSVADKNAKPVTVKDALKTLRSHSDRDFADSYE